MAKILLIDDDDSLRRFLQDALAQRGHDTRCLDRTDSGMALLATGEFDLVLVDENLPGMSGSQFLKILRSKGIDVAAILMTGLATGTFIQPMKELDAFVVGKPAGGYGEFFKDLSTVLDQALQGDAEITTSLGRAVTAALRMRKGNLFRYLRTLLDRELLIRVAAEVGGNAEEARRVLGVPLAQLTGDTPALSFQAEALLLIANHRELTVDQIAERLDCSRSKLYRDPILKQALKNRAGAAAAPPKGYKSADGEIEAWDR